MLTFLPETLLLLLVNVAVFALQNLGGEDFLLTYFALWPLATGFEPGNC